MNKSYTHKYLAFFGIVLSSRGKISNEHSYSKHSVRCSDTSPSEIFLRKPTWLAITEQIEQSNLTALSSWQRAVSIHWFLMEKNISSSRFAHLIHLQTLLLEGSVLVFFRSASSSFSRGNPEVKGPFWRNSALQDVKTLSISGKTLPFTTTEQLRPMLTWWSNWSLAVHNHHDRSPTKYKLLLTQLRSHTLRVKVDISMATPQSGWVKISETTAFKTSLWPFRKMQPIFLFLGKFVVFEISTNIKIQRPTVWSGWWWLCAPTSCYAAMKSWHVLMMQSQVVGW